MRATANQDSFHLRLSSETHKQVSQLRLSGETLRTWDQPLASAMNYVKGVEIKTKRIMGECGH